MRDHTHRTQARALPAQFLDHSAAQAIERGQRHMGHAGQVEIHPRRTKLACAQLGELAFENQAGLGRLVSPYPDAVDLEGNGHSILVAGLQAKSRRALAQPQIHADPALVPTAHHLIDESVIVIAEHA